NAFPKVNRTRRFDPNVCYRNHINRVNLPLLRDRPLRHLRRLPWRLPRVSPLRVLGVERRPGPHRGLHPLPPLRSLRVPRPGTLPLLGHLPGLLHRETTLRAGLVGRWGLRPPPPPPSKRRDTDGTKRGNRLLAPLPY